jgi:hypothetical protein
MRETPSPIDLEVAPLDAPGLAWTARVLAVATLLLLAINARSLADWIDDMPPSPAQTRAALVADNWVTLTEAVGVGVPRRWLHERWKAIEAARF